jgi:hypothetical protein
MTTFADWFAGSRVVNADGTPMMVFHGTATAFDSFKLGRHQMVYFTTEAGFAWEHAEDRAGDWEWHPSYTEITGPTIVPAYVRALNPWDYANPKHVEALLAHLQSQGSPHLADKSFVESVEDGDWSALEENYSGALPAIKALGYDAMWITEGSDMTRNLAVFDTEQIRFAIGARASPGATHAIDIDEPEASLAFSC